MRLRFRPAQIPALEKRYVYARVETDLMALCPEIRRRGHLTKEQLQLLAYWKSPRSAGQVEKNSESFVKEITGLALSASDERSRIEPLTLLDGVSWPTASVILHMFHRDGYPILDVRALWSASVKAPSVHGFALWSDYVAFTRSIAERASVSMRVLDRALWQYSKENQETLRAV